MPSRFPLADSAGLVLQEIIGLLRSEVRLMKAELHQNVAALRGGLVLAVIAGGLAILGLGILLNAAVAALVAQGFSPAVAGLIVGGGALFLAAILGWIASRRLTPAQLVPERSLRAMRDLPADAARAAREATE